MKGINRDVPVESNFHRAALGEISSNQTPLTEAPINNNETAFKGEVFLVFAGFLGIVVVLRFCRRLVTQKPRVNNLQTFNHCQKIPCSNCRFYKNEPYLKCAVHPLKVLKSEAIGCPDYWSLDSNKFPH